MPLRKEACIVSMTIREAGGSIPSKEDPPRTQKVKSHRIRAHVLEVRHRHRQQSIAEICSRVLENPM